MSITGVIVDYMINSECWLCGIKIEYSSNLDAILDVFIFYSWLYSELSREYLGIYRFCE